jgi:hypothetical protein
MSDEPIKHCEKCGKEVRRLILGGTGVIFKGSGFYVTDKGKSADASRTAVADKGKKPDGKTGGGEAKITETAQTTSASPTDGNAKKSNGDASKDATASKTKSPAQTA